MKRLGSSAGSLGFFDRNTMVTKKSIKSRVFRYKGPKWVKLLYQNKTSELLHTCHLILSPIGPLCFEI